jgi:hypothetical protein
MSISRRQLAGQNHNIKVRQSLPYAKLIKHYAMKVYEGVDV